jgi:hypothetical protein
MMVTLNAPHLRRNPPGILTDDRDCPVSPGMSIPPSPFGAADRTLIRVNPRQSVANFR